MKRPRNEGDSELTAEDPFVDDGSNGQAVEAVGERFPQLDVVASLACRGEEQHETRSVLRFGGSPILLPHFYGATHSLGSLLRASTIVPAVLMADADPPDNEKMKTRLTLVVESVDPVDGRTFVVAPENEEVLGVFALVSEELMSGTTTVSLGR
jgi:hypothetical protein